MIPFWFIFPAITAVTFLAVYLALYSVSFARFIPVMYLSAAGVGLAFWFFFDTMGDAGALQENNALYPPYLFGGVPHLALIGAFVIGVFVLGVFDHFAVPAENGAGSAKPFLIPMALAIVMGIHGLGEGWGAVSGVSGGTATTLTGLAALVQAYGTFPAVVSYPIHKFLEAAIVGAAYVAFVLRPNGWKAKRLELPVLGLCFAGPSAVGAAVGYFVSFDTTYFYAFGVTAALYAAMRLGEALSHGSAEGWTPSRYGLKTFSALLIGFLLLYTAALLH
ncbi:MAG: hypothetical protein JRM73_03235 [Nitrososphaerota archaeon]|nr:hypothetical protein [Nitrososphaerota archaeon]